MAATHSTRFKDYDRTGVGMRRGDLRLTLNHSAWAQAFSSESSLILEAIGQSGLELHHIGSTSVPGLAAKPIIDILGVVNELNQLDLHKTGLEQIGYEYKGEYGIVGRRYCVLYDPEKLTGYFHLHFFEKGNPAIEEHLVFRDYLRATPRAVERYEQLKRSLIDKKIARMEYSPAKGPMIEELLREARHWRGNIV